MGKIPATYDKDLILLLYKEILKYTGKDTQYLSRKMSKGCEQTLNIHTYTHTHTHTHTQIAYKHMKEFNLSPGNQKMHIKPTI